MRDRIPAKGHEGRFKITPESGGASYMVRAEMYDSAAPDWTPLNEYTLLQDDTARLFHLDDASPNANTKATPNNAFRRTHERIAAITANGGVTDAMIGNRAVTDSESGTIVTATAKQLTPWLQGIRNNLKWTINKSNALETRANNLDAKIDTQINALKNAINERNKYVNRISSISGRWGDIEYHLYTENGVVHLRMNIFYGYLDFSQNIGTITDPSLRPLTQLDIRCGHSAFMKNAYLMVETNGVLRAHTMDIGGVHGPHAAFSCAWAQRWNWIY